VKGKDVILEPKANTFEKHVKKTRAIGNMLHLGKKQGKWYVNKKCNHGKNEVVYSKNNHFIIVEQVQKRLRGSRVKNNNSLLQFCTYYNKASPCLNLKL
jgi:hypothetical protein